MSKRVEISDELQKKLKRFYLDKRCILTKNKINVDWHHLDENSENTYFANLIPISRDYNLLLEKYRRIEKAKDTNWRGYDRVFSPEGLLLISQHDYMAGDVSMAYGSARLASWMIRRYPSIFKNNGNHLIYSLEAMKSARHAGNQSLMIDIVERDFEPYIDQFNVNEKLLLLEESAAIYQEYGKYLEAKELFDFLDLYFLRINGKMGMPSGRMMRRSAILKLQSNSNAAEIGNLLNEARAYNDQTDTNRLVGILNSMAWNQMMAGYPVKALDILDEVIQNAFSGDGLPNPLFVGSWNAFETILTYYNALDILEKSGRSNRKSQIEEQLRYISEMFIGRNLKLRPIALNMSSSYKGNINSNALSLYEEATSASIETMNAALEKDLQRLTKSIICTI